MPKYDVFISYRRNGGYETAKHLYDLLVRDGYKVSFDIDTLRDTGNFKQELMRRIAQCKDFVLIVDAHTFDRTLDPSFPIEHDWLRQELAHALRLHKHVIPIFLEGADGFPRPLPADIQAVEYINGPIYTRHYFDEFYRTLKNDFLHALSRKTLIKRVLKIAASILVLLFIMSMCVDDSTVPADDPQAAQEQTSSLATQATSDRAEMKKDFIRKFYDDYVFNTSQITICMPDVLECLSPQLQQKLRYIPEDPNGVDASNWDDGTYCYNDWYFHIGRQDFDLQKQRESMRISTDDGEHFKVYLTQDSYNGIITLRVIEQNGRLVIDEVDNPEVNEQPTSVDK